jgi:integrase
MTETMIRKGGGMKAEKNLKFKDGKWYIDFTFKGKRIRKFGGYTKEQARNTLAKLRIDKLDETLGFKKPKAEAIAFEKFADEFLEIYAKQNKRSWQRDELSLKNLKLSFKGKTLQDIGPEDIERFKAKRRTEVSDSTTNREIACLKTLFNKSVEWGRLEINPIAKVKKFREPNCKERILTESEVRRLIEATSAGLRPIVIIALNTGMRRGEILSLRWKDVDFHKGFIFIGDSKSGRSRSIPMNSQVFEILKNLPKSSEFVFFNPETKDHIKDVKTGFKAACRRAGIKNLRLHDLRHTAASWMVEVGIDLVTVSRILGHSTIQMTMRYAHPTPENMRRAVEKLAEKSDQTRQKVDMVEIPKPVILLKTDN